jgi:hypothetical protein
MGLVDLFFEQLAQGGDKIPGATPTPVSMATPQTNVRIQPGIKAQAKAAAEAEGISVSQFIERALIAWLAGQCTGANTAIDTGAGVIPDLVSRIEAIERRLETGIPVSKAPTPTPAPKHPRQDAQQGASTRPQVSQHPPESGGLTVGAALIAAGAELPEAYAMGANRDERMRSRYGMKAREWLEEQGWERRGRSWYPPAGG